MMEPEQLETLFLIVVFFRWRKLSQY